MPKACGFKEGDRVVNMNPAYKDDINTVSYTNGHAIWFKGHSPLHGYVPDNFRLATPEEEKLGRRILEGGPPSTVNFDF